MTLPINFPPPAGYSASPKWDGRNFVFDDQITPVLEYSENFSGWSDELTALHEESAGDSHPIDLASRKHAIEQVGKYIPSSSPVVMEIGCSSGFFIRDLVRHFPEALVFGVDVVKAPLYRLAGALSGVPLIRFDLLRCPLPDKSVDVLVMLNVLEHIEDDVGALEKSFNLLKPGGVLIIEVPAGKVLYDAYDAELNHFRRYSSVELERKLGGAGFEICRKSHLGFVLFPAFALIKLVNRMPFFKRDNKVVSKQAKVTSTSLLVRFVMWFESKFLFDSRLPFGIRVLMTARRPK